MMLEEYTIENTKIKFYVNFREAIYMMLEEYTIGNTQIKFYDDYIVQDSDTQKEYIDNIIINLMNKSSLL